MANWINEEISIAFDLPKSLAALIETLEQLDRQESYAYFNYYEALDDGAKELCAQGKLTQEQWDLLCLKYSST